MLLRVNAERTSMGHVHLETSHHCARQSCTFFSHRRSNRVLPREKRLAVTPLSCCGVSPQQSGNSYWILPVTATDAVPAPAAHGVALISAPVTASIRYADMLLGANLAT